jgi:hypothetical protein
MVAETREKTVVLICSLCFEYYLVMIYTVLDIDTSVGVSILKFPEIFLIDLYHLGRGEQHLH